MCPGSVFWATIFFFFFCFFFFFFFFCTKKEKKEGEFQLNLLLKRLMYIAWACFQNVISVIASQMFYICALVHCFLPNQNQAFVTLLLMLYYFISSLFICDSYATMWWPIIGNKFYSILFYSILFYSILFLMNLMITDTHDV